MGQPEAGTQIWVEAVRRLAAGASGSALLWPRQTRALEALTAPTLISMGTSFEQEGGGSKRSASAERGRKENNEERDGDEEQREGSEEEREGDEKEKQGQSNSEPGEWLLPSLGEEDDEAADGGLKTAVTLGGGILNPATLLEKRGIARYQLQLMN
ncbi:hypothetical protein NDU88_005160 [Pleurodeles waltl]|uniref:Uncharacterized protein n=1 Tax=Pleurodeles waltl TaxID=8319 RepID=A0AAV7WXG5_PLEWA|nr:hypothetical protein NDU88_005160 [Pleurodeles waltl]